MKILEEETRSIKLISEDKINGLTLKFEESAIDFDASKEKIKVLETEIGEYACVEPNVHELRVLLANLMKEHQLAIEKIQTLQKKINSYRGA